MSRAMRLGALGLMLVAGAAGLSACAPQNTNTTYTGADIGRSATVSYGQIVGMHPVTVQGNGGGMGVGTLGGAAVGGVAGSFIGGDPRTNVIGAIGGAILGGLAGHAIEDQASRGAAVEFLIREDNGQTISVVQTNEENFQVGERVVLTRGARTRIARAGN